MTFPCLHTHSITDPYSIEALSRLDFPQLQCLILRANFSLLGQTHYTPYFVALAPNLRYLDTRDSYFNHRLLIEHFPELEWFACSCWGEWMETESVRTCSRLENVTIGCAIDAFHGNDLEFALQAFSNRELHPSLRNIHIERSSEASQYLLVTWSNK
jgi:hypothetical protein